METGEFPTRSITCPRYVSKLTAWTRAETRTLLSCLIPSRNPLGGHYNNERHVTGLILG